MDAEVVLDGEQYYIETGDVIQRIDEQTVARRRGMTFHCDFKGYNVAHAAFLDSIELYDEVGLKGAHWWATHPRAVLNETLSLFVGARLLWEYMYFQAAAVRLWGGQHASDEVIHRCTHAGERIICWRKEHQEGTSRCWAHRV